VLAFAASTAHAHDGAIGSFGAHNDKPHFLSGPMSSKYYGAGDCPIVGTWCGEAGDDLLTGGLGATGLLLAAPAFANALPPTPAEVQRNARASSPPRRRARAASMARSVRRASGG
jgi:hypothetical protein